MEGIHFVVDGKGRKVAVQIDLERYGDALEDLFDQLLAEERKDDERIPFDLVRRRIARRRRKS